MRLFLAQSALAVQSTSEIAALSGAGTEETPLLQKQYEAVILDSKFGYPYSASFEL